MSNLCFYSTKVPQRVQQSTKDRNWIVPIISWRRQNKSCERSSSDQHTMQRFWRAMLTTRYYLQWWHHKNEYSPETKDDRKFVKAINNVSTFQLWPTLNVVMGKSPPARGPARAEFNGPQPGPARANCLARQLTTIDFSRLDHRLLLSI